MKSGSEPALDATDNGECSFCENTSGEPRLFVSTPGTKVVVCNTCVEAGLEVIEFLRSCDDENPTCSAFPKIDEHHRARFLAGVEDDFRKAGIGTASIDALRGNVSISEIEATVAKRVCAFCGSLQTSRFELLPSRNGRVFACVRCLQMAARLLKRA
jgi:hypothetical protein